MAATVARPVGPQILFPYRCVARLGVNSAPIYVVKFNGMYSYHSAVPEGSQAAYPAHCCCLFSFISSQRTATTACREAVIGRCTCGTRTKSRASTSRLSRVATDTTSSISACTLSAVRNPAAMYLSACSLLSPSPRYPIPPSPRSSSRDSGRIVSVGGDRAALIWDVRTGRCVGKLRGHTERINTVTHCAEDDIIATGSADKTVRLWDCRSNRRDPVQVWRK